MKQTSQDFVSLFGGYSSRVTPDPISNSEVKPTCADGTARVTVWESRSSPNYFCIVGIPARHETPTSSDVGVFFCGCIAYGPPPHLLIHISNSAAQKHNVNCLKFFDPIHGLARPWQETALKLANSLLLFCGVGRKRVDSTRQKLRF